MAYLANESAGFTPTRKFHVVTDSSSAALCGATPTAIAWNVTVGDRAEFERLCPERVCSRCRKVEASVAAL